MVNKGNGTKNKFFKRRTTRIIPGCSLKSNLKSKLLNFDSISSTSSCSTTATTSSLCKTLAANETKTPLKPISSIRSIIVRENRSCGISSISYRCLSKTALIQKRTRNHFEKRWSEWETIVYREDPHPQFDLKLGRGGSVKVWKQAVSEQQRMSVDNEMQAISYREYKIQTMYEPRLHVLYHQEAEWPREYHDGVSEDRLLDSRPGFSYGRAVIMRARPLSEIPCIQKLGQDLEVKCQATWNVGVDVLFYRDGRDSIGKHSDSNQNETRIVSALIKCPSSGRKVMIQTKEGLGKKDRRRDEQYQLFLQSGDVYEMDGEMQLHYDHSVPKDSQQAGPDQERKVIVFRQGEKRFFAKDTGRLVHDTKPRVPKRFIFGPIQGLKYGYTYRRQELVQSGGHLNHRRGISGNSIDGANAIIVSGKGQQSHFEDDRFGVLLYAANSHAGSGAIVESFRRNERIRVFRTQWKPTKCYRYDGLYKIVCTRKILQDTVLFVLVMDNWDDVRNANTDPTGHACEGATHRPEIYNHSSFHRLVSCQGGYKLNLENVRNELGVHLPLHGWKPEPEVTDAPNSLQLRNIMPFLL